MKYEFFGVKEFIPELSCSEQYLYFYSAEHDEYENLLDFGNACIYEDYRIFGDFLKKESLESGLPIPKRKIFAEYKKEFFQQPISEQDFFEKFIFCTEGLIKESQPVFNYDIKTALVLKEEWNSLFIVAELKDSYIGYWWRTSA